MRIIALSLCTVSSGGTFYEANFIDWVCSWCLGVSSYGFGVRDAGRTREHIDRQRERDHSDKRWPRPWLGSSRGPRSSLWMGSRQRPPLRVAAPSSPLVMLLESAAARPTAIRLALRGTLWRRRPVCRWRSVSLSSGCQGRRNVNPTIMVAALREAPHPLPRLDGSS